MKTERYITLLTTCKYGVYLNPAAFDGNPPSALPIVDELTLSQALKICERLNDIFKQSELYRSWWNQGMKAHDELAKNWSHVANSNRLYRDECLRLRRLLDSIHAMTQPAVVSPAACKRDWSEQREQM